MSEERPNIEEEINEAAALHADCRASPQRNLPRSRLIQQDIHVETEPLAYGDVCQQVNQGLWEGPMTRELERVREQHPYRGHAS